MAPFTKASPAAMPSEPPMKPKSCTAMVIGMLFDAAEPDLEGVLLAGLGAGILEAVE